MDELDSNLEDFKSQLSELTFEQLIELKQKVGAKVYNEGIKPKTTNDVQFNRANKNRPREMSSKIRPPRFVAPALAAPPTVKEKKDKIVSRDPRFEDACGVYDEKKFKTNYKFLDKIRRKERKVLQKEMIETTDPERKSEIKILLQRMDNKEREEKKKKLKESKEREEKELRKQAVKDGKKPFYCKKSEKRLLELVDNYEQLKSSGKLNKHLERRMKKNNHKERKKFLQTK
ncbi:ribosomal RNA processing protein 36 homolog [Nilaparvata lugens]|uniref:ribosomal RNA processing protein 36 homolog n=1 Tax=Nilaparvata lugens TaxID=108931 RepID=UPI000B996EC7|nr:ribosomal RNA processing protein 36 homolog [Nilaparvata lugens]XP_022186972.1 ribosomal RNA processing protein 36 homolog [Nilaparvata lugens]